MAHPSVSKSRPTLAQKVAVSPGAPARHKAQARKSAAPGPRHTGHGTGTQADGSRPVPVLPEHYWTQFMGELLNRTNLPTTEKGGLLVYVMPDEPAGTGLSIDMAHLAAGTELLARGILAGAAPAPQGQADETRSTQDFVLAYSLLVRGVPEERRGPLLQDMRRGLEEAAKDLPSHTEDEPPSPLGEDALVSTRDFMADLLLQETAQRARDIDNGLLVPGATLAARLKMSPQGLHHARKTRRMFALQGPSGELVYPAFFADPRQDRKRLEAVSKVLGDMPGAAKWDFFMSLRLSLGNKTPLDALAKGKVTEVMAAARAFAEE